MNESERNGFARKQAYSLKMCESDHCSTETAIKCGKTIFRQTVDFFFQVPSQLLANQKSNIATFSPFPVLI